MSLSSSKARHCWQRWRRELAVGITAVAKDGTRIWRKATPIRTGTLRRSEGTRVRISRDTYSAEFLVRGRGAAYYGAVAGRYPALRNQQVVSKWARKHAGPYLDAAIDRALRE